MERKTIGSAIIELREAENMSVKELAERLSVTEKTVRRWESGESSPDLSAVPVIAEIFGVSCDALLRGGHIYSEESQAHAIAKSEREKTRIITRAETECRNHSIVSGAFLCIGVAAGFILNMSFRKPAAAFFTAVLFYAIGVMYQCIIMNNAFTWMKTCELDPERIQCFKKSVIRGSEWIFGITSILMGFTIPVLFTDIEWILIAPIFGTVALLIFRSVLGVVRMIMVRKGVYTLSENERAVMRGNMQLKKVTIMCLVTVLLATAVMNFVLTRPEIFADHVVFNDYESFEEFMNTAPEGMEIPPEAHRIRDGEGNILLEYVQRRGDVKKVSYELLYGNALPIFVWTDGEYNDAMEKVNTVKKIFGVLYTVESVGALVGYVVTRNKYHLEERSEAI